VRAAEDAGLDAVAVTDHDNMSACSLARGLARKVTIIPGMEISTRKGTHIIGLFLKDEIVSRDILGVIDEIHEQGGLAMIPHPFRRNSGLLYARDKHQLYSGEEISQILARIDLIELASFNCSNDEIIATNRYFGIFPDIAGAAGSDAHIPENIGRAYVELEKVRSDSLADIKKALLESPRFIRYEAYTADKLISEKKYSGTPRKKTLLFRTKELIPRPVRNSIRSLYNRSAGLIFGSPKKSKAGDST